MSTADRLSTLGGNPGLNPVVIFVGAVIAAGLAGIAGLLRPAPILATLRLFGRYVIDKCSTWTLGLGRRPLWPHRLSAPGSARLQRRLANLRRNAYQH